MMRWIVLVAVFGCWCSAEETGDSAVDLYYKCFSDRDTNVDLPPILLLHGLGGDSSASKHIYETLALQTKRKVCMADARNHGKSPKTEEFTFDLMAADTVRLMDTLKMTKALLVGQSMGAKTASVTALKYPDRVDKVVLEDMRPNSITPEAFVMIRSMLELMQRSLDSVPEGATDAEAKATVIAFLKEAVGQALGEKVGEHMLWDMVICENEKCRLKMDLDFVRKVIDDPEGLTKVYDGRYDGDALFVYGTLSPFKVGEAEEEIRPLFPKAQLVPVEGAGHAPSLENPQEYLSAVTNFINGDGFCKMP